GDPCAQSTCAAEQPNLACVSLLYPDKTRRAREARRRELLIGNDSRGRTASRVRNFRFATLPLTSLRDGLGNCEDPITVYRPGLALYAPARPLHLNLVDPMRVPQTEMQSRIVSREITGGRRN